MAFGQVSGPPASGRQVKELLALLQEAGHSDFRDARGPMGFTQRQAGGKFTAAEASVLIDRLLEEQAAGDSPGPEGAGGISGSVSDHPSAGLPNEPASSVPPAPSRPARSATRPSNVVPLRTGNRAPAKAASPQRLSAADEALRRFSADKLVAELRRRGYTVTEPAP